MKKTMKRNLLMAISLTLFSCLVLSAYEIKATPSNTPSNLEGNKFFITKSHQDMSGTMDNTLENYDKCVSGRQSDAQFDFWEVEEFENWMKQQYIQNQQRVESKEKSFFYKDGSGSYMCREWTQEDVDSLYESWQNQLAMMKEGYHFTKQISLSDGGLLAGAFDPETWNEKSTSAFGSTTISLPDGSIVDLGQFDTVDAAQKAVQKYLKEQVSVGNMTQIEADSLLKHSSVA